MAQPSVGVSFKAAGLAYLNTLLATRGGQWSVIARDYDGANTNISPGSSFASPMAVDGNWRGDLFAVTQLLPSKKWVYVQTANLGFYPLGLVHPDGVERAPKTDSDPLQALQLIDPVRVDIQKRDKTLMFTPLERNPFVDAIQYNYSLDSALETAGADGTYFAGEEAVTDVLRRQIFVMHEDIQGGMAIRHAFPFPKCLLTDQGSSKGNKKDADAPKFTLSREIDNWFVAADGTPLLDGRWSSGPLQDATNVPALTFRRLAPVGTPTAATTATIVLEAPIGGTSPYTYTTSKSASANMSSPSAPTGGTAPAVSNGVLTFSLTGLTTATTSYYQVTATDSDGATAKSAIVSITQP